jgi:formylglycine-generating enzyme required for sulfatase activity
MAAPPSTATSLQLLRWRSRTQVFVERADGLELAMVRIPSGSFVMGSPEGEAQHQEREGPQHQVQLGEFLMGRTPITQAQWREVAGRQERDGERWERKLEASPSRFTKEGDSDQRPVEQVSWLDAMEFCRRLRQRTGRYYTLPSEAQWEYACRAGTSTPFAFGETITPELANYDGNFSYGNGPKGVYRKQTTPVGTFTANAWGLQDMHGNVWEWCLDDWHGSYEGAPVDGSAWVDGAEGQSSKREGGTRLLRGGSWNFNPRDCRSALRLRYRPVLANGYIGFRVVCLPQGPSLNL